MKLKLSRSALLHTKTRVSLKYLVTDRRWNAISTWTWRQTDKTYNWQNRQNMSLLKVWFANPNLLKLFQYAEFNGGVHFFCFFKLETSLFYQIWSKKSKIVSLSWILVTRLNRMGVFIFFVLNWKHALFGQTWSKKNKT